MDQQEQSQFSGGQTGQTESDRSWSERAADTATREWNQATQSDVVQDAKAATGEMAAKAKQVVDETMSEAKDQVRSTLGEQKARAADQLTGVAEALRQTSQELHNHERSNIAQYADAAADQVERFSSYLKDRDFTDLWDDIQTVAHRQPEVFVAGALAAGFLIGRFFKSSDTQRYQYSNPNQQNFVQNQGSTSSYYRPTYEDQWSGTGQNVPVSAGEGRYGG